ncbi:hypothetical protein TRIUR3_33940 [Triticum urartu]|uniref:Uncharacterized protein n=1 Tax=Triticum urartu TaxID=4572 RepID=M7ZZ43_TRIUA|nr:hypothetical protein TRIUR3_33940 [Triticum urartu]
MGVYADSFGDNHPTVDWLPQIDLQQMNLNSRTCETFVPYMDGFFLAAFGLELPQV